MIVSSLVNIEGRQKSVMMVTGEWLHEEVSEICRRGSLFQCNGLQLYELPDIMVSDIDVLYLPMVFSILRQCNSPPTISLYNTQHIMFDCDLIQPTLHPDHLLCTPGHGNVLRFNCGKCYGGLSFAAPSDSSPSHSEDVARGGPVSVTTSTIISIDESGGEKLGVSGIH